MIRNMAWLLIVIALQSCANIHARHGQKLYTVPQSFEDSVKAATLRLNNSDGISYVVFTVKYGNCFGDGLVAYARFVWTDGTRYFQRNITKDKATKKRIDDRTVEKNSSDLFSIFALNRIDTVTSLPSGGIEADPASHCYLAVKANSYLYTKQFDMTPFFTTKDTLHPLYVFVKKVLK